MDRYQIVKNDKEKDHKEGKQGDGSCVSKRKNRPPVTPLWLPFKTVSLSDLAIFNISPLNLT